MTRRGSMFTVAAVVLTMTGAGAQTQPGDATNPPPAGQRPSTGTREVGHSDAQTFVREMAIANMAEVKLGEMAAQKGMNNDVKAFGQMMTKDHTQANKELTQIASQLNVQTPAQLDQKHRDLEAKLSKLEGAAFDREYMTAMVQGHEEVLSKLRGHAGSSSTSTSSGASSNAGGSSSSAAGASSSSASGGASAQSGRSAAGEQALNQWVAKTTPVVQQHLQRAQEIQQKVGR